MFCLVIHPWMDFGLFQLLTTVCNAAMDLGVQIPVRVPPITFGHIPRNRITGSLSNSMFDFF